MRTTPRSAAEALSASRPKLLPVGRYPAEVIEAFERLSDRGNEVIHLALSVTDADGKSYILRSWLADTNRGAAMLRNACTAVGALERYEAGEISAADFMGQSCCIRVVVEKRRGFPERNVVEDFSPSAGEKVIALRSGR